FYQRATTWATWQPWRWELRSHRLSYFAVGWWKALAGRATLAAIFGSSAFQQRANPQVSRWPLLLSRLIHSCRRENAVFGPCLSAATYLLLDSQFRLSIFGGISDGPSDAHHVAGLPNVLRWRLASHVSLRAQLRSARQRTRRGTRQ